VAEDSEAKHESHAGVSPDAVALHTALSGAEGSSEAKDFLRQQRIVAERQTELLDLQIIELKHELKLRHWSLRFGNLSAIMKATFEVAVALIFVAILIAIGTAVWSAAHDNSLVIEAFSVPPEMANRGLTGQAVATQVQDRLAAMQAATRSSRAPNSYVNNWGNDIKVEIPDTGISIGESYRALVARLGHQTHITGEVWRTADGIAVTVRSGDDGGATFAGKDADFDALMQKASEAIYERTQPYRFAIYRAIKGDRDTTKKIFQRESIEGLTPRDRAWAYVGLSVRRESDGDPYGAVEANHEALALIPDLAIAYENIDTDELVLGHDEAALSAARAVVRLLGNGADTDLTPRARNTMLPAERVAVDTYLGDFNAARNENESLLALPSSYGSAETAREQIVFDLVLLHDGAAARAAWHDLPPPDNLGTVYNRAIAQFTLAYEVGDWRSVLSLGRPQDFRAAFAAARLFWALTPDPPAAFEPRQERAYAAYAMAAMGDLQGARALIARTPLDCDDCLRVRGRIDALAKDWSGADHWFAEAARQAPSIPAVYSEWGAVLLAKGDIDGAIEKFKQANERGPHFADPLEMWGEALMAKNRSDLALAKFTEADQYAPRWGRLHLKWGEALYYAGKPDDSKKQFAVAARLDLAPDDKVLLAKWMTAHG
jgi:tetratricopeptide (TPR) repeat protein